MISLLVMVTAFGPCVLEYKSVFPWPVHLIGILKKLITLKILIVFFFFGGGLNVKTVCF